jgi:hypothetical protein
VERAAVDRRHDALRASIKETDGERLLEVGNDLRNRGLRDAELGRRLGHAAASHDGEKDLQVPEAQPPAEAGLHVRPGHRQVL